MTTADNWTKRFGASGITREMFLDCFAEPINMSGLTDEQMESLAKNVEDQIRQQYPDIADKMFARWLQVMNDDNPSDEQYDEIAIKCSFAWGDYWTTLEKFALASGGVVITEEESDEE